MEEYIKVSDEEINQQADKILELMESNKELFTDIFNEDLLQAVLSMGIKKTMLDLVSMPAEEALSIFAMAMFAYGMYYQYRLQQL